MKEASASALLEYLYDQLDMLATIDLTNDCKVDTACRVNKAVNDTSRSILGVAELSMKAMGNTPSVGKRRLLGEFFEDDRPTA